MIQVPLPPNSLELTFFIFPPLKLPQVSKSSGEQKTLQIACDSAYLPSSGPLIYSMYDSSKIKW